MPDPIAPDQTAHTLAHNGRISDDDAEAALRMIAALRVGHLGGPLFVKEHGLREDVFLPANVWADISKPNAFFEWTRNKLDLATAISPFSGFHLMMWARQDAPTYDHAAANAWYSELFAADHAPAEADAQLTARFSLPQKIAAAHDGLVETWRKLTDNVPQRYRIKASATAGLIGSRHGEYVLNPDVLSHQSRLNALYGAGVLESLERKIAAEGSATYLEIGPGLCSFAHALNSVLEGRLRLFLIDLPTSLGNAVAYLHAAAGRQRVSLATADSKAPFDSAYTLIPNYLIPWCEARLPPIDLAHNAISLNEMSPAQVDYYLALIKRVLGPDGVFHLSEGGKYLDYHTNAQAAALGAFPHSDVYKEETVRAAHVIERPNSFMRVTERLPQ